MGTEPDYFEQFIADFLLPELAEKLGITHHNLLDLIEDDRRKVYELIIKNKIKP